MALQVVKQNVGIDISMKDFAVCIYQRLENDSTRVRASRKFSNNFQGFEKFLKWTEDRMAKDLKVTFTMEATGVYYENLAYFLHAHECYVSVQLPNRTKSYIKSTGAKTKTDKVDAQALGQMGVERNLLEWYPGSKQMRMLKGLCRERISIIRERTAIKNKRHALKSSFEPSKVTLKRLEKRIKLADEQVGVVEIEIEKLVSKDLELKEKVDNICMIKGVGITTVATIIAETNGFALFTSLSQLISYAGYDVVENQSGKHNGKTKISKQGSSMIRAALHFPAINAKRWEPMFKQFYERIFDRTKIKMKGNVAVQSKLLGMIYTLFKKNEPFDPFYHEKEEKGLETEEKTTIGTDKNDVVKASQPTLDGTSQKVSPSVLQI